MMRLVSSSPPLPEQHNSNRYSLHASKRNGHFSDLRKEYKDYKTATHWRVQKIEPDLSKAFLQTKQIRIDMQESLDRQAIDIRKNAEEITLHAKEEWQDAPASTGIFVIRSLEQKMAELKLEVNALKKGGRRKSQVTEDVKRDACDEWKV
ncbi:hypothetical protein AC579_3431 [Pseudocercospora musae]|uniref:Uncharacterized protein n=1 Tax=Pseudocercospora musae TaxID=113226 RepID=A0A139IC84_9PEZI|nr:hypothetical protein AC579_3431 [Pseudocercospora musae]